MTDGPAQDPGLWSRRSTSFGAAAHQYAEHRPDYAPAAVRWALDAAPGPVVVDLGAGTGALTAGLVAAGASVTAVEPDADMRAELTRQVPGADAVAGSAEGMPVADDTVDLVTAATSFHWFDERRAILEIARVLRPGGVLALFYDVDDLERGPWLAGLDEAKRTSASTPPESDAGWSWPEHRLLGRWRERRFPHAHRRTAASLTETIATQSHVLVVPEAERAETLARVPAFLAAQPETAVGSFDVPLETVVARSRVGREEKPRQSH